MPFDFDQWKQIVLVSGHIILSEGDDLEEPKSSASDMSSISELEAMLDEIERDIRESRHRLDR